MASTQKEQGEDEQFPWESPLPTGAFWDDITAESRSGQGVARTLKHAAFTPDEFAAQPLDASLPRPAKLAQLATLAAAKAAALTADEPPERLDDAPFAQWRAAQCSAAMLRERDQPASLATLRAVVAASTARNGSPDVGALNALAFALKDAGRYAEAEHVARRMLPLLRAHEMLGPASPQMIGCLRLLMEVCAKQGREQEARELNGEGYAVIRELAKGRFSKYEGEEIEEMDRVREEISKWSGSGNAAARVEATA